MGCSKYDDIIVIVINLSFNSLILISLIFIDLCLLMLPLFFMPEPRARPIAVSLLSLLLLSTGRYSGLQVGI